MINQHFIAVQELNVRPDEVLEHRVVVNPNDAKRPHLRYDAMRADVAVMMSRTRRIR